MFFFLCFFFFSSRRRHTRCSRDWSSDVCSSDLFTDPLLRSRGALFVRPDFFYHAPGDANLRGFTTTAAGRWAMALNVEETKPVWTRRTGLVRAAALYGFFDGGLVDSLAIPSYNG